MSLKSSSLPVFVVGLFGLLGLSAPAAADQPADPMPTRPKVAVLVSVTAPGGVAASFGTAGTDEISVRTLLVRALEERGFSLVSAVGEKVTRVAVGEEAEAALLADASAADLARKLGAGVALIVSVEGKSDGRIRGTLLAGGVATGAARLLDVGSGRVIAERTLVGAGWGANIGDAVERAFRDAAGDAAAELASKAAKAWPADVASSSARMSVTIQGARSWGSISAIIRRLAVTKGVLAVHPESVSGGDVRLALETSLSGGAVISAIRDARLQNGSLSAKSAGSGVSVTVRGD